MEFPFFLFWTKNIVHTVLSSVSIFWHCLVSLVSRSVHLFTLNIRLLLFNRTELLWETPSVKSQCPPDKHHTDDWRMWLRCIWCSQPEGWKEQRTQQNRRNRQTKVTHVLLSQGNNSEFDFVHYSHCSFIHSLFCWTERLLKECSKLTLFKLVSIMIAFLLVFSHTYTKTLFFNIFYSYLKCNKKHYIFFNCRSQQCHPSV